MTLLAPLLAPGYSLLVWLTVIDFLSLAAWIA